MNAQIPIQNFQFNNSLQNSDGNLTLSGVNYSYQADRNSLANNALSLAGGPGIPSYVNGIISNIPLGNTNRTISFWAKVDYNATDPNTYFSYGSPVNSQAFGFDIWLSTQRRLIRYAWGAAATFDNTILNTFQYFNWNHYVITYNGASLKTYINGQLMFTDSLSSINTVGSELNIGKSLNTSNYTTFGFDDFQIYDIALNDAQISQLYVENNFNLGVVPPTITSVSNGVINANNATINFSVHARGAETTYLVRYGLSAASLTNVSNGIASTNLYQDRALSITVGSLTSATTYYYRIEATNSAGTTLGNIQSFTTLDNSLIHEFKFNNSAYNEQNNLYFYAPSVVDFYTTDRFGNPNSAITKSQLQIYQADTNTMPIGASPRTISVWIKPNSVNADNIIFSYGTGSGNQVYGASFSPTTMFNFTYSTNLAFANTTTAGNWKHFVVTYDASNVAKIYVNGVLGNQGSFPFWSTVSSNKFYLGNLLGSSSGGFNGAIDDLKIYNRALTAAEVLSLYNNNTLLSSQSFNQNNLEVKLYPNPVCDILNIEIESDIQSIEIYNIQGQKVLSSNQKQINVSDLTAGMYMVRIQDVDNNIATKKIIIK